MQLGTRWTSGDEPPRSVPAALADGIRDVDAAIPGDLLGQPRPRWTLTWLEGRPIAELDNGVIVSLSDEGSAVVSHDGEPGLS
ncbi:hypothetical protein [Microbacterium thalassium]|uniref:Fe-S oxidoreductase n=1 Tax=Microbacterium thalassium TaxID=362649 RepID=A0A7X0KVF8_9MICO|nr:hypothetical protein [Microbacterium thalassium]MBB6392044.1 hypothetical protein [Microbacterium thalassium]GLK24996.1 hypothetical protein GCM10017607_23140 [Microbacterium thalassium]